MERDKKQIPVLSPEYGTKMERSFRMDFILFNQPFTDTTLTNTDDNMMSQSLILHFVDKFQPDALKGHLWGDRSTIKWLY